MSRHIDIVDTGVFTAEKPRELAPVFAGCPTIRSCRLTKAVVGPIYLLEVWADEGKADVRKVRDLARSVVTDAEEMRVVLHAVAVRA